MEPSRAVEPAPDQRVDPLLYRIVVGSLAAIGILTLIIAFILSWMGKAVPESIYPIAGAAVGALAGLLAPSLK